LDRLRVESNGHVIVVLEINIDGDDAGGVERILAENIFVVPDCPEYRESATMVKS